jgi:peptidoglycan/LPS O-acetylase OafA/YrhL
MRVGGDSFSIWIDAFRWLAAASVLITHTGIRMLAPVADLPARSWGHDLYAFAAGFDHQAVMVFFVLSGLLVGGPVVREIQATGRLAAGRYMLNRAVRLGLVLWPALAVVALCDGLAIGLGAVQHGVLPDSAGANLALPVLVCNMLLLQTAACIQFGGNGALWSLFNEAWYYTLFPCFALAVLAPWRPVARLAVAAVGAVALAGLTALQFTGSPLGPYMLVWGVGVAAALCPRPLMRDPAVAGGLLVVALLLVRLAVRRSFAGQHPMAAELLDLGISLLFGNLLLSMRHCPALRPPPWTALHGSLAGFSFSLYCTHIPVLGLMITTLMATTGTGLRMQDSGVQTWAAVAGALLVCVGFAYGFSRLTEAHTDAVRRHLAGLGWRGLRPSR